MTDTPPDTTGQIDDVRAAQMLRWRRRAAERISDHTRRARADIGDTEAWLADITAGDRRELDNIDRTLTDWLADELERDPDGPKSRQFPAGVVKSSAGGLSVDVVDSVALLAWAEQNAPDLIVVPSPSVPKSAAKALDVSKPDEPGEHPVVTVDGEVVPGVRLVRRPRSFKVEETDR